jgi:hypothetical protein
VNGNPLLIDFPVATYRFHYEDEPPHDFQARYPKDFLSCYAEGSSITKATQADLAWVGSNPAAQAKNALLCLFKRTWENPHPDKKITSIDLYANSNSTPFVLAITVQ